MHAKISIFTGLWLLTTVISLFAQDDEPNRLRFGASLGAGGVHTYVKPSIDLHYSGTTLRIAPGLFFLSGGVTQRLFPLKYRFLQRPPFRTRTPLILSAYYHYGWGLTGKPLNKESGLSRDGLHLFMLMFGLHGKLDRLNRVYWEGSVGLASSLSMYPDGNKLSFFPMAEIRLGGIIQLHKIYKQKTKKQK